MKYLPHLCFVAFGLGFPGAVRAQSNGGDSLTHEVGHWHLNVVSEKQLVRTGDAEFGFEAELQVCSRHGADGFVEFTSRSGDLLRLVPVWGTIDWQTGGVVLTFVPVVEGGNNPDNLCVVIIRGSLEDSGGLVWDFAGGGEDDSMAPPLFEAAGSLTLSRRGGRCEPSEYGQLNTLVSIDTPLQTVEPLPPSHVIGVEARLRLDRDQSARGFLDVHLPRETVSYEPIFGAAFPGDDEFLVRTMVVLLLADREAPLNTNDHVLRATVVGDQTQVFDPATGLFWDLQNGDSGAVNGTFEALGDIRVWPPHGRRTEVRGAP